MAQLKDTIIRGGLEVVSDSVIGTSGNLVFKDEANGGDYYGHIDIVTPNSNDTLNTRAMRISSYSKNIPEGSESEAINILELGVNDEGTETVYVSSPNAWRTGIDAAASSHNHSASNITSGTLPVTRGGTGRTVTASGAMYATSAGGDIIMGKLPIAQGGTGATTAANARSALGAAAKSWTSIGSVKSNESINIKNKLTGYSEIMVIIGYGSKYWSSCVLRASSVTDTLREWYTGGGTDYASSWNAGSGFYISTTEFRAMYVYLNSSSAKTATAYLYAR